MAKTAVRMRPEQYAVRYADAPVTFVSRNGRREVTFAPGDRVRVRYEIDYMVQRDVLDVRRADGAEEHHEAQFRVRGPDGEWLKGGLTYTACEAHSGTRPDSPRRGWHFCLGDGAMAYADEAERRYREENIL